ncbi:MAG: DUF2264 domain-containing protein [Lachnospiraceae bacterium]|nr:DUF2264 domain-containing protein [Lachnospiraceae bacterium]
MELFMRTEPDYELSPYTGLTRQHWIEAGEYLLKGIFQNIPDFDAPVVMPRKDSEVTYPHSDDNIGEKKAEYFEGLARSMFIAAPLIHNDPELEICGYNLREYYKSHILRSCSKCDEQSVGTYDELRALAGTDDPTKTYQQTVETCALVICLHITKSEIWDTYEKSEKDIIAKFLFGFANGNTVPQNWRLFNMLDLAFLHSEGYDIDKDIMREHASAILAYYAGDGWYRDGHSFDYYSCWAFQVYGPLWCQWYGYENEPYIASRMEKYSNELMKTYDRMFDRDGYTNMWGRSNIYRNAATSAFEGNMFLKHPTVDMGLARRIASGSLLQFITRDDFLYKGVPTLGFYGQFMPLVQRYSCAESPFWLGKAFLCLDLPSDHPFWISRESNGVWDEMADGEVRTTTLDGPALCFSNHQANGETVLRTAKVVKDIDDRHGMWNYSKLCYNTKYPWEAAPSDLVEAQQYVLFDEVKEHYERANVTFYGGESNGVLYRRQFFNYGLDREYHWIHAIDLADIAMPYGILRADKIRLFKKPMKITLGAYGFADNGTEIIEKSEGFAKAIILKGHDHMGCEKQLAMTIYDGWSSLNYIRSCGTNPDSEKSVIVYAETERRNQNHYEPCILVSQVITKESWEDFGEDEIFPITKVSYTDPQGFGGYGPVNFTLKNGQKFCVDFEAIEGTV